MWYLVLSRDLGHDDVKRMHREAHAAWLDAQHRAGRALFSGPATGGPDREYGVYILLASDLAAGRALAAEDPYHQHGVRALEQVLAWNPGRALRLAGPTIAELEGMARGDTGAGHPAV